MIRPASRLTLHAEFHQGVVTVHVGGSLEYGVTESLVAIVRDQLDRSRSGGLETRQLDLDVAELTFIDSMGLAALLMIRRVTDTHGAALRINHRPLCLERLLQLTGTLDYLTAARAPRRSPGAEWATGESSGSSG